MCIYVANTCFADLVTNKSDYSYSYIATGISDVKIEPFIIIKKLINIQIKYSNRTYVYTTFHNNTVYHLVLYILCMVLYKTVNMVICMSVVTPCSGLMVFK